MPAAVAIPLITGLAPAVGAIGGAALQSRAQGKAAKTQSNAALEAARIQDASLQRAEAEQRRIHDDLRQQNEPYLQGGQQAVSRMGGLLSQGPNWSYQGPTGGAPVLPPRPEGVNRLRPIMAGSGQTPAAAAAAPMVTMKAPTGQVKQVPAAQVEYFAQRGASVVR